MFHDTRIYVPLARGPEKGLAPLAFCRSAINLMSRSADLSE